jgi:hypothetical protein
LYRNVDRHRAIKPALINCCICTSCEIAASASAHRRHRPQLAELPHSWRASAPNLLEVADFTYVPMAVGFGYTAFVIDAYAGLIPG